MVANAAVRTDFVAWDFSALEQLQEKGARHFQHIGGILSRQLGVDWDDADRIAFTDFSEYVHEQPQCRHGYGNRVSLTFLVKDLDLLCFCAGLQIGRQRTAALAGDGNFLG